LKILSRDFPSSTPCSGTSVPPTPIFFSIPSPLLCRRSLICWLCPVQGWSHKLPRCCLRKLPFNTPLPKEDSSKLSPDGAYRNFSCIFSPLFFFSQPTPCPFRLFFVLLWSLAHHSCESLSPFGFRFSFFPGQFPFSFFTCSPWGTGFFQVAFLGYLLLGSVSVVDEDVTFLELFMVFSSASFL